MMKKAYVKPVFMAEEFMATATVAVCPTRAIGPMSIVKDDVICESPGHAVGHQQAAVTQNNLWDYSGADGSSNIFTSGTYECDFVWNSATGPIGIWTTDNKNGVEAAVQNQVKYQNDRINEFGVITSLVYWFKDMDFMGFFRNNQSTSCTPMYPDDDENTDDRLFS